MHKNTGKRTYPKFSEHIKSQKNCKSCNTSAANWRNNPDQKTEKPVKKPVKKCVFSCSASAKPP